MSHPLLQRLVIDRPPGEYLRSVGGVFAEFGVSTQDSGNISYGVQVGDSRYFVKTAGLVDDPLPVPDHAGRVALLRNTVRLNASVTHSALPPSEILRCLDTVFDLHTSLAHAGWVAVDFYDGSLLYDFAAGRIWVVDLDMYQDGPFHNGMGEMFGSSRFKAPEESELDALIDEQTTVFVMGRAALVFLSDGTLDLDAFRGPRVLFEVVAQACRPDRARRFASMATFQNAWRVAWGV